MNNKQTSKRTNSKNNRSETPAMAAELTELPPKGVQWPKPMMRDRDTLPDVNLWPNQSPLLFCINDKAVGDFQIPHFGDGPLPFEVPFDFETSLFHGQCLLRVRDGETKDGDYFHGRNRKWQLVMQGKFKQQLPVANMFSGSEFCRPFQNMPPPFITKACEKILKTMSPHGNRDDFTSDTPRIMSCTGSLFRTIRVDREGNQPDIKDHNLEEDCTVFGGKFSGGHVSSAKRKKYLSDPTKGFCFDTNHVYTLEYYDHLCDIGQNVVDLYGIAKLDTSPIFDRQPFSICCKTGDGQYLWNFQLWHKDIV